MLDFIRYEMDLPGTKIGCREGDCGACTVLEGTLELGKVSYKSIVSCLTPIGNVHGKHIVTIEGINLDHLSPVQKAFVENAATQCGFCTPGFIMSLTAHSLSREKTSKNSALASISGNICRCTGYKSIEKAAEHISELLKDKNIENPISWLVENKHLPEYFLGIPDRLLNIKMNNSTASSSGVIMSGGTDLMVQRPDELVDSDIHYLQNRSDLKGIKIENGKFIIGASTTVSEIERSEILNDKFPGMASFFKLISSEPIRNMATIAGNIANASPIGDLSIIFLALDANVCLNERTVNLKDFFLGYKKLNLNKGEFIKALEILAPNKPVFFNFEKVSKRQHLDIASVNTAILLYAENDTIVSVSISAGGVSPIPLYLKKTCEFLKGKNLTAEVIIKANDILQDEIAPITDIRGSAEYKRLLLKQLFFAHFIKLFPEKIQEKIIFDPHSFD